MGPNEPQWTPWAPVGTRPGHPLKQAPHSGTPAGHLPGGPSNSGTLLRAGLGHPVWANQAESKKRAFCSMEIATFILARHSMQKHSKQMLKKWSNKTQSRTFGTNAKKMLWKWSVLILDGRGRARIARPAREMPSGRAEIGLGCPDLACPGLVCPGLASAGLACPGLAWLHPSKPGLSKPGMSRPGLSRSCRSGPAKPDP